MPNIGHAIKSRLPGLLRRVMELGQRFGVNITPNHFYSEIPDLRHLRSNEYWRKPLSMHAIQGAEIASQSAFVQECCLPFVQQLKSNDIYARACAMNCEPGFGPIEADFLYCYIRAQKPKRIIQVGCGVSTALVVMAAAEESAYQPQITCIEPFPTTFLRGLGDDKKINLIAQMAQQTPLETFTALQDGDLLFVDSTHSLRPGSEVVRIIAEVMPRLRPGVRVHFHDIPFPYDFSPSILKHPFFIFREPVMLYAFLTSNSRYRIDVSLAMLHHESPSTLRECLPNYAPCQTKDGVLTRDGHFPSSIYLRAVN